MEEKGAVAAAVTFVVEGDEVSQEKGGGAGRKG